MNAVSWSSTTTHLLVQIVNSFVRREYLDLRRVWGCLIRFVTNRSEQSPKRKSLKAWPEFNVQLSLKVKAYLTVKVAHFDSIFYRY